MAKFLQGNYATTLNTAWKTFYYLCFFSHFLPETIHETALEHEKQEKSTKAEEFSSFFDRIRVTGEQASNEDIMKFAKLFEDELTLDSLPRDVVVALCKLLEIGIYGLPSELLRFQLRMRLRNLKSDDRVGTHWLIDLFIQ